MKVALSKDINSRTLTSDSRTGIILVFTNRGMLGDKYGECVIKRMPRFCNNKSVQYFSLKWTPKQYYNILCGMKQVNDIAFLKYFVEEIAVYIKFQYF